MSVRNSSREVISRVGQRRQVVIPKQICDKLRLREGDFVAVSASRSTVVIKPKKLVDPDDTLTPAEETLLAKAERQMRRGEHVNLASLDDALDSRALKRSRKTA